MMFHCGTIDLKAQKLCSNTNIDVKGTPLSVIKNVSKDVCFVIMSIITFAWFAADVSVTG